MKVFISCSGERSLAIARTLREWLPRVIQAVQPWMSESDIEKGVRWEQEIGAQLGQTKFGIICLTPENLDSRWMNFEAGAISKIVDKSFVCTYLLDLKPTDIEGPLSQFNHTKAEKDETRKLLQTLNRALGEKALGENIIDDVFGLYWSRLEEALNNLPSISGSPPPARKVQDMIEEVLELVRAQAKSPSYYIPEISTSQLISMKWLSPDIAQFVASYYEIPPEEFRKWAFSADEISKAIQNLGKSKERKLTLEAEDKGNSNESADS